MQFLYQFLFWLSKKLSNINLELTEVIMNSDKSFFVLTWPYKESFSAVIFFKVKSLSDIWYAKRCDVVKQKHYESNLFFFFIWCFIFLISALWKNIYFISPLFSFNIFFSDLFYSPTKSYEALIRLFQHYVWHYQVKENFNRVILIKGTFYSFILPWFTWHCIHS